MRRPSRSTYSVKPTFCPSTEMLKRSDSWVTVVGAPVLSVVMTPLYPGIGAWTQRGIGQRWCGQPRHRAAVSAHRAEAIGVVLPLLPVVRDVVVAAADEVPPHHQLLGKR